MSGSAFGVNAAQKKGTQKERCAGDLTTIGGRKKATQGIQPTKG